MPSSPRTPFSPEDPLFSDKDALLKETKRIFDICNDCRLCFNLCDVFPRLFDQADSPDTSLDTLSEATVKPIVDACTLCDMCYGTTCPYVPPHAFDVDFPKMMLGHRAHTFTDQGIPLSHTLMKDMDMAGRLGTLAAPLANYAMHPKQRMMRKGLEAVTGLHHQAYLPPFVSKTLMKRCHDTPPFPNPKGNSFGKHIALYATCLGNYNYTSIGMDAIKVLSHQGVSIAPVYPECCGMPQFEHGDIQSVRKRAYTGAKALLPFIEAGNPVVALTPSCALMLKHYWPLLCPEDANIRKIAEHTFELCEYLVHIAKADGITPGLTPLSFPVSVHLSCHGRAQQMGKQAKAMLELIPEIRIMTIERCSGHGGSWGMMEDTFETAMRLGKPVVRYANAHPDAVVVSDCPLAHKHILQGMGKTPEYASASSLLRHPIQLMALSYAEAISQD